MGPKAKAASSRTDGSSKHTPQQRRASSSSSLNAADSHRAAGGSPSREPSPPSTASLLRKKSVMSNTGPPPTGKGKGAGAGKGVGAKRSPSPLLGDVHLDRGGLGGEPSGMDGNGSPLSLSGMGGNSPPSASSSPLVPTLGGDDDCAIVRSAKALAAMRREAIDAEAERILVLSRVHQRQERVEAEAKAQAQAERIQQRLRLTKSNQNGRDGCETVESGGSAAAAAESHLALTAGISPSSKGSWSEAFSRKRAMNRMTEAVAAAAAAATASLGSSMETTTFVSADNTRPNSSSPLRQNNINSNSARGVGSRTARGRLGSPLPQEEASTCLTTNSEGEDGGSRGPVSPSRYGQTSLTASLFGVGGSGYDNSPHLERLRMSNAEHRRLRKAAPKKGAEVVAVDQNKSGGGSFTDTSAPLPDPSHPLPRGGDAFSADRNERVEGAERNGNDASKEEATGEHKTHPTSPRALSVASNSSFPTWDASRPPSAPVDCANSAGVVSSARLPPRKAMLIGVPSLSPDALSLGKRGGSPLPTPNGHRNDCNTSAAANCSEKVVATKSEAPYTPVRLLVIGCDQHDFAPYVAYCLTCEVPICALCTEFTHPAAARGRRRDEDSGAGVGGALHKASVKAKAGDAAPKGGGGTSTSIRHQTTSLTDFINSVASSLAATRDKNASIRNQLGELEEAHPSLLRNLHTYVDGEMDELLRALESKRAGLRGEVSAVKSSLLSVLTEELLACERALGRLEEGRNVLRMVGEGSGTSHSRMGELIHGTLSYDSFLLEADPPLHEPPRVTEQLLLQLPIRSLQDVCDLVTWTEASMSSAPQIFPK